jgi:hypothetical protein
VGGLTGCKDGEDLSGENKITSFKIGDAVGFIDDTAGEIKITVAPTADVGKLVPVIAVSEKATAYPPSGAEVDISYAKAYTVTAENDDTRIYKVEAIRLDSIAVEALKTTYDKGVDWDPADVVVTGIYSDGVTRQVTTGYTLDGYDPDKEGPQTVAVVLNGKTAVYDVIVTALESIEVYPLKDTYANGAAFNAADIVVWGSYSDGTRRILPPTDYTITLYDDDTHTPLVGGTPFRTAGSHTLVVATANGKTETAQVIVDEKDEISISIGLPNDDEPVIFGLPATGGIVLSAHRTDGLPEEIVISTASGYANFRWYIDNVQQGSFSGRNIVEIKAGTYTLKIPHTITFVGTKDGVEYSKTITSTVVW